MLIFLLKIYVKQRLKLYKIEKYSIDSIIVGMRFHEQIDIKL